MSDNHNEISVIGSLLISPETLSVIEAILTPSDFESERCKQTYLVALKMRNNGEPIDAVTIGAELRWRLNQECTDWLIEIMSLTPTAANVEAYCKLVKQDANKRRLKNIAEAIDDSVFSESHWQEIASEAMEQIGDISDCSNGDVISSEKMAGEWGEYYEQVVKNPNFAFCKTGFSALDNMLGGGMFRQGMYIIGARPGMGKTTLGINIAENIAKRGDGVLLVSIEMSRVQVMSKRIAREGGISYTKLMTGGLSETGREMAREIARELAERPFYLIDKSRVTVIDIGRAARQIQGLTAIVIDYLGLVKPEETKANKPRYEEMTDVSADIKALAKLLKIPILVLCQLNRENATSADKRPQLQHLRDSGAIEQDADGVILLHRPEYYSAEKFKDGYIPPESEEIELIMPKNRHGETGVVKMSWRGKTGEIIGIDTIHSDDNGLPFVN